VLAARFASLRSIGLFGVQIFFGLSGLLITSRLVEEESRHGRISLRVFYTRRFFRIIPPAFTYLLVVGALAALGLLPISLGRWFGSLFCFANYSPAASGLRSPVFDALPVSKHEQACEN
jgi:peptidoglycan/LPS O-acetylase OafA/YrhL